MGVQHSTQSDIAAKIQAYCSTYPLRKYPKGQILVFANENPDYIFYMLRGRVRKYAISYRGEEVIINTFQPPSFFPMSWAINKTPNQFFYKAETEVELHTVPDTDALAFLQQNPDVVLDLLSRLYTGLEGFYGRLVHLMSGTARSRLIYELIIECRRFGKKQNDDSYLLTATETDLAARSGLSRETVNREMKNMKQSGWVTINKQHIAIQDVTALEQALGTEV